MSRLESENQRLSEANSYYAAQSQNSPQDNQLPGVDIVPVPPLTANSEVPTVNSPLVPAATPPSVGRPDLDEENLPEDPKELKKLVKDFIGRNNETQQNLNSLAMSLYAKDMIEACRDKGINLIEEMVVGNTVDEVYANTKKAMAAYAKHFGSITPEVPRVTIPEATPPPAPTIAPSAPAQPAFHQASNPVVPQPSATPPVGAPRVVGPAASPSTNGLQSSRAVAFQNMSPREKTEFMRDPANRAAMEEIAQMEMEALTGGR